MSFIILILIIILLYISLSRYSSIYKVLFMAAVVTSMTTAFLFYGMQIFRENEIFTILNTEMNMTVFIHACLIWFAADILVIFKIVKNLKKYNEVNSARLNISEQG